MYDIVVGLDHDTVQNQDPPQLAGVQFSQSGGFFRELPRARRRQPQRPRQL